MHAFLIVGQSAQERAKRVSDILTSLKIKNSPLNRFTLSPSTLAGMSAYGIDDIRALIRWTGELHTSPGAAIIEESERMTEPAQHALLKTLEEGAPNVSILLTAYSEQSLLQTIRSRCQIVRVVDGGEGMPEEESQRIVSWLLRCSKNNPAMRILSLYQALSKIAGKTVSPHFGSIQRQDGLQFLEKTINALHENVKGQTWSTRPNPSPLRQAAMILKLAFTSHRQPRQNLNVSLVLQQFMIDISK